MCADGIPHEVWERFHENERFGLHEEISLGGLRRPDCCVQQPATAGRVAADRGINVHRACAHACAFAQRLDHTCVVEHQHAHYTEQLANAGKQHADTAKCHIDPRCRQLPLYTTTRANCGE
jgi:hypothetical protein